MAQSQFFLANKDTAKFPRPQIEAFGSCALQILPRLAIKENTLARSGTGDNLLIEIVDTHPRINDDRLSSNPA